MTDKNRSVNYIGVVGTSSAGKTTILKSVEKRWSKESNWFLDSSYRSNGPWTEESVQRKSSSHYIAENEDFVRGWLLKISNIFL